MAGVHGVAVVRRGGGAGAGRGLNRAVGVPGPPGGG